LADGSAAPTLCAAQVKARIPPHTGVVVQWTAAHFGPAIGLSAFAGLWRAAAALYDPVAVPPLLADGLWWLALAVVAATTALYAARAVVARELVWVDVRSNRLANFFFAPVIAGAALVTSAPAYVQSPAFYVVFFFVLLVYQLSLSLLLYGEWLFGSPYSLRRVDMLYFMAVRWGGCVGVPRAVGVVRGGGVVVRCPLSVRTHGVSFGGGGAVLRRCGHASDCVGLCW